MAYQLKYRSRFADVGAHNEEPIVWRIEIEKDGYTGDVFDVDAGENPVEFKREDSEPFDVLLTSEVTVNLVSDTDFKFDEFFTADSSDYRMKLIKESDTDGNNVDEEVWRGINIADTYEEPFTIVPYEAQIRFTDGFNYLSHVRYKPAELDFYSGQKTLRETLFNALDKSGLDIDTIEDGTNAFHEDISQSDSPLNNTYIANENYRKQENDGEKRDIVPWSCTEVVEGMLKGLGCCIFQWKQRWWIMRWNHFQDSDIRVFKIKRDGTENSNRTLDNRVDVDEYLHQDQTLRMQTDIDRLLIKYTANSDLFSKGSIAQNHRMVDWEEGNDVTDSNKPVGWSVSSFMDNRNIVRPSFVPGSFKWDMTPPFQFKPDNWLAGYDVVDDPSGARHSFPTWFGSDLNDFGSPGIEQYEDFSDVSDKWIKTDSNLPITNSDHIKLQMEVGGFIDCHEMGSAVFDDGTYYPGPGLLAFYKAFITNELELTQRIEVILTRDSDNTKWWLKGTWRPNGADGDQDFDFTALSWEQGSTNYLDIPFNKQRYPNSIIRNNYADTSDQIQTSQEIFEVIFPDFPFTGAANIEFFIYPPWHNIQDLFQIQGSGYKNTINGQESKTGIDITDFAPSGSATTQDLVAFEFWSIQMFHPQYQATDEEVSVNKTITLDIDQKVTREKINMNHGDGPNPYASSSYRGADELVTQKWNRWTRSEEKDIHEIVAEDMAEMMGERRTRIGGTIMSSDFDMQDIFLVSIDKPGGTTEFEMIPLRIKWDLKMKEYNVDLYELERASFPNPPDTKTPSTGKTATKVSGTGTGIDVNDYDADKISSALVGQKTTPAVPNLPSQKAQMNHPI